MQQIKYNDNTGRLELDGHEFHCGDTLSVLIEGNSGPEWVQTRLEYSKSWYLVGLQGVNPVGLFAKVN